MATMFNQRHYIAVADTIGLTLRQIDQQEASPNINYHSAMSVHKLIDNLEVTFKEDNSRFKADVFNTRIGLVRREGLQP